jgi:fumarate hydratase class II
MRYVEGSKKVFMQTGTRFPRKIVWSVALIKQAAAKANSSFGLLDPKVAEAIGAAAQEAMDGKHDSQVMVDVFQTGSGTGINMNLNELIAERASQLLRMKGAKAGSVHPNDHVNMGQSSNDVVPSAVRMAAVALTEEELAPAMRRTSKRLSALARRTSSVYKAGRTHLRDALPVTMGQEFASYADAMDHDLKLLRDILSYVRELPIGGTAVGTGANTDRRFGPTVVREINERTGLDFTQAKSSFRAMKLLSDLVILSSILSLTALDLYRLCQDLRLMFSGPSTGLGEIDIPTQAEVPGSSIMPGKTNPVTVEAAMLVSAQVMGLDKANQVAGMLGEFELSMGVPLLGYNVVTQVGLLSEALRKTSSVVIDHVVANVQRNKRYAETSSALITAISPSIGYDRASRIGKRLRNGSSTREALKELGYSEKEVNKILDLRTLVGPETGK